jgi:hypothetical protein
VAGFHFYLLFEMEAVNSCFLLTRRAWVQTQSAALQLLCCMGKGIFGSEAHRTARLLRVVE